MVTEQLSELFVEVDCPVCNGKERRVLRPSSFPPGINVAGLKAMYRASSDHELMDQVVQCQSCRMVFLNPRLNSSVIIGGYQDVEDPTFVSQNPQRIHTFSRSLQSIAKRIGMDPHGKRMLDIGCAGGACLVAARDLGFEVEGIEPSRWLSNYGRTQYGLSVRQGILEPGIFPERSFDMISLWDVLEHVPSPLDLLLTVHSLLTPDGVFILNFPDIGSVTAKLMGWRWPFWLSVHLHYYTRETMRRHLEKAGFEISYMSPHWQELQLGYLMERASSLVGLFRPFSKLVRGVGLGSVPFSYNMGQTLVVCKPGKNR